MIRYSMYGFIERVSCVKYEVCGVCMCEVGGPVVGGIRVYYIEICTVYMV